MPTAATRSGSRFIGPVAGTSDIVTRHPFGKSLSDNVTRPEDVGPSGRVTNRSYRSVRLTPYSRYDVGRQGSVASGPS